MIICHFSEECILFCLVVWKMSKYIYIYIYIYFNKLGIQIVVMKLV